MSTLSNTMKKITAAAMGVTMLAAAVVPSQAYADSDERGWRGNNSRYERVERYERWDNGQNWNRSWNRGRPDKVVIVKERAPKKVVIVKHAPPQKVVIVKERPVYVERQPAPSYPSYPPMPSGSVLNNQTGGTIIGAILGAAAGSQFGKGKGKTAAVIGGAVIGGILGGKVGAKMDSTDQGYLNNTLETSPTGQESTWVNPDSGAQYMVKPTNTYSDAAGQPCRDYTTWVMMDGVEQDVQGTACRTNSGSWVQQL